MTIEYLADRPEFIPTLAEWQHQEWGALRPGEVVEGRAARLRGWCGRSQIPLTVVAVSEDELLGSASLIEHDMNTRMELTPWLAGVFVAPQRRRQGIGAALVHRILEEGLKLGVPRLYLYTVNSTSFYSDLGWRELEQTSYRGKSVTIMSYSNASAWL
jgi:N-acetylglutamate synthase-like GNAT family acetyltransferase